jgi:farnesyl-diphosphate farnesyltransferase
LIRRELRPHVHAFYRFARNADDIADNPVLPAEEKVRRLDRMSAVLDGASGEDSPSAAAMRESLAATRVTAQHCHDVLRAFRLDATKLRYRDWDDLMGYCRYSASPVGRQLLDLHGESRATWPASDALCSALQVLNHLQDCAQDYRLLDRVYLPQADLAAAGIGVVALDAPAASPALRLVLDRLLDRTAALVEDARALPPGVAARGLRAECAVIVELAARLTGRLRRGDPLATRVKLRKSDFLAAFMIGWRTSRRR